MDNTTEKHTRRWKTCLHEAAHQLAAIAYGATPEPCIVFAEGGGVSLSLPKRKPDVHTGIVYAAGPAAADGLAAAVPPPKFTETEPMVEAKATLGAAAVDEAMADYKATAPTMTDARHIALICVSGVEDQPDEWRRRYNFIHHVASVFVRDNAHLIVELAGIAYRRGCVTPKDLERLGIVPEAETPRCAAHRNAACAAHTQGETE